MDILDRFKDLIYDGAVVYELGCCDAYHSGLMIEILQNYDNFSFHCFEANPDLHEIAKNVLDKYEGDINFVPKAIGKESGKMTFYKSEGVLTNEEGELLDRWYGSSSILKPTEQITKDFKGMYFNEIEVDVISLDDYYKGGTIDFIWADIQGAEKQMIQGGQNALANTLYLYLEYSEAIHYEGQAVGLAEILDLLPNWSVVEDYGGDALLKNTLL